jgi:hypothetical protein
LRLLEGKRIAEGKRRIAKGELLASLKLRLCLRDNMGQSKSKETGFKQGFKDNFRRKVLKSKDRESNDGCGSPPECPTHLISLSLSVYPVSFLNLHMPPVIPSWVVIMRKLTPTKEREKQLTPGFLKKLKIEPLYDPL